jgi:hypothetical protein
VTFALRRPGHFTVTFDAPTSERKHPNSAAAAENRSPLCVNDAQKCGQACTLEICVQWRCSPVRYSAASPRLSITPSPFDYKSAILKFAEFVIDQSLPIVRLAQR